MAADRPREVALSYSRALSFILLLAALPGQAAEPLDCGKLYPPAGGDFAFRWRKDRCEGLVQGKVAQHISVRISYFAYGSLDGDGARRIENNSDAEMEIRGELSSGNTFYRLVARLAPRQSIEWRYPPELTQDYGFRPERIAMLAARPGAKENVFLPFTVSGSKALSLGVVSTDFRFNSVEVKLYDGDNNELCQRTHNFGELTGLHAQRIFAVDLCGKSPTAVRRISVVAVQKLPDRSARYSSADVIQVE